MKITVSTRQRLTFTPEVVDKEATKAARAEVPPEERDEVEDVMKPDDCSFDFWPLSLTEEEDILEAITGAEKNASGGTATPARLINRLFREKLCGWSGLTAEDAEGKEIEFVFDPSWEETIPDEVIQGIPLAARAAAFAFLIEQAGMGGKDGEEAVGK